MPRPAPVTTATVGGGIGRGSWGLYVFFFFFFFVGRTVVERVFSTNEFGCADHSTWLICCSTSYGGRQNPLPIAGPLSPTAPRWAPSPSTSRSSRSPTTWPSPCSSGSTTGSASPSGPVGSWPSSSPRERRDRRVGGDDGHPAGHRGDQGPRPRRLPHPAQDAEDPPRRRHRGAGHARSRPAAPQRLLFDPARVSAVAGRRVALVDDVISTGGRWRPR